MSNINVNMPILSGFGDNGVFKIEWTYLGKNTLTSKVTSSTNSTTDDFRNAKICRYDFLIGHYYGTVETAGQMGDISFFNTGDDTFIFSAINSTVNFDENVLFFRNTREYNSIYGSGDDKRTAAQFAIPGINASSTAPFILHCKYVGINLTLDAWGGKIVLL